MDPCFVVNPHKRNDVHRDGMRCAMPMRNQIED
jgi:hypothetical protein